MRDVHDNYSKYVGMARKLKNHLLENFTEESQCRQFADAVWEGELDIENWLSDLELEFHE